MNSHLADAAAGEGPREAAPAARIGTAGTLLMLVRRELWEHRALWIAPLVVAALMVCGAVVAGLKYHLTHGDMSGDDRPGGMAMFAVMQGAASTPLSVLFTGIWEVNAAFGRVPPIPGWDMLGWLKAEIALLACLIVGVLWYAPYAAYLLLVSAWARRTPFLWATLPPVVAQIVEHFTFDTTSFRDFLASRPSATWPPRFG